VKTAFLLAAGLALGSAFAAELPGESIPVRSAHVYFSPEQSGEAVIRTVIDGAKERVIIAAFHFTSKPIAESLIAAHRRGVDVTAVLDKSNLSDKKSKGEMLLKAGVPVYIDSEHRTAHNKVIVADGRWVVTGSYNFNGHAEHHNAENLLVLDSPELAAKYEANLRKHTGHAAPLEK
jgi:phosphatidylserine/phosphatidylglycerophosphate/cardiolipin synthase-like enzyme